MYTYFTAQCDASSCATESTFLAATRFKSGIEEGYFGEQHIMRGDSCAFVLPNLEINIPRRNEGEVNIKKCASG